VAITRAAARKNRGDDTLQEKEEEVARKVWWLEFEKSVMSIRDAELTLWDTHLPSGIRDGGKADREKSRSRCSRSKGGRCQAGNKKVGANVNLDGLYL
jgi:hypothetical protein